MSKLDKIQTSDEAWDEGKLGTNKEHAKPISEDIEAQLNDALELQLVSIRLQKSLIEDFKFIATLNGLGYQPLMRQVLTRFADCEKKRILREHAAEMKSRVNEEQERTLEPRRKTA